MTERISPAFPAFISTQCNKDRVKLLQDAAGLVGLKSELRDSGEKLSSNKIVSKGHVGLVIEVNDYNDVFDFWDAVKSLRRTKKHD